MPVHRSGKYLTGPFQEGPNIGVAETRSAPNKHEGVAYTKRREHATRVRIVENLVIRGLAKNNGLDSIIDAVQMENKPFIPANSYFHVMGGTPSCRVHACYVFEQEVVVRGGKEASTTLVIRQGVEHTPIGELCHKLTDCFSQPQTEFAIYEAQSDLLSN